MTLFIFSYPVFPLDAIGSFYDCPRHPCYRSRSDLKTMVPILYFFHVPLLFLTPSLGGLLPIAS